MKNASLSVLFGLTLILVLAASMAKAQAGIDLKNNTPQQRAQKQTGLMKEKLQLDSTQTGQVQAINLKYALQMEPVIKSQDSKLSRLKQAKAVQKMKEAELKEVLIPDQFQKYQAFKAEMRELAREKAGKR
ncbi:MAG: hypothetical protein ABIN80_28485 [Dyadobacter sp.]|uniref:hypothetical protein n=1 Tax=Dyadobacter sp. TaxID=1914288 RepID=UPI003265AAC9